MGFNFTVAAQEQAYTFLGIVIDSKTGNRLPSTVIEFNGIYTTSNIDGYFEFASDTAADTIKVSMLGYVDYKKFVELTEDVELVIKLEQKPIQIEQVTVSGERYNEEVIPSDYHLQIGDLRKIPQLGELDALRSLYAFPGVSSTHDFSAQLYIRGGNFDENLISLDGVPIYNPYHLGGITGIVSTDLISDEYLYPSNYTPNYGGYLSSVLSMISKDGNGEKLRGSVSLGLVSSGISLNGPLFGGTFSTSYRRTYWDLITSIVYKELPYNYSDIFLKYSIPVSENSFVRAMFFTTNDQFKVFWEDYYESVKVDQHPTWGNVLSSVEYQYLFSKRSSIKGQVYYSSTSLFAKASAIDYGTDTGFNADNSIKDLSALVEYRGKFGGHSLTAGVTAKLRSTRWKWDIGRTELDDFINEVSYIFFDYAEDKFSLKQETELYNFYALDSVKINRMFDVTFGGRMLYYTSIDKFDVYPFIHFTYKPFDNVSLVLSYGKYYQEMYTIKELLLESFYSPFSVYFLPESEDQFQTSDHYLAGIKMKELIPTLDFSIDAYCKQRYNLAASYKDYNNHYKFENGYAAGVELMLKHTGWLNGWISYSYSRSVKDNEKYEYYSQYDRMNNFKCHLNMSLSSSWNLSLFFVYSSGLPITTPDKKYIGLNTIDFNDRYIGGEPFEWRFIDGAKNSERIADYHRLDLGFTGTLFWDQYIVRPYLQVMNVYNSANPFSYGFHSNGTSSSRGSFITPTIGVTVEF